MHFRLGIYLGTVLLPLLAAAEGVRETITRYEDEIVVTAHRVPLPLRQVGSSVSIISREKLAHQPVTILADLLRDLPGMAVSRTSTLGSLTEVRLRGSEANHLKVILDGIEVNDLTGGNGFYFSSLGSQDLERVELVRGPQSALYGSDAVAGVLNIKTKDVEAELEADFFLEKGSLGTDTESLTLGVRRDLWWAKVFRTNFSTKGISAYSDNLFREEPSCFSEDLDCALFVQENRERDPSDRTENSWKFYVTPGENLEIGIDIKRVNTGAEYDQAGLYMDTEHRNDRDFKADSVFLEYSHSSGAFELTHNFKIQETSIKRDEYRSLDDAAEELYEKYGVVTRTLQYSGLAVSENWNHSIGWKYRDRESDFDFEGPATLFAGAVVEGGSLEETSVSLEYIYRLLENLTLSAGGEKVQSRDFENVFTYRGAVSWSLGNFSLKASRGTGRANPTFVERFGRYDSFVGNPDLLPERNRGFDLGVEYNHGNLWLDFRSYREVLKDEINGFVWDQTLLAFTADNGIGPSVRDGYEFQGRFSGKKFSLEGSYAWLDASGHTTASSGPGDIRQEFRRPRHSGSFTFNRSFGEAFSWNLNVSYTGKQLNNCFPYSRLWCSPPGGTGQVLTLSSYVLVNSTLQYRLNDEIQFQLRGENILDREYTDVIGYNAPGRRVYLSFKYSPQFR